MSVNVRQRENREGFSYCVNFKKTKSGGTELLTGHHVYGVDTRTSRASDIRREHYIGPVYCIGVPDTHNFVIRQDGAVWVSGNSWFKSRFVDPWRKGNEEFTRFIPATVADNRFVDSGYQRKLEENVGWKLRAYRYGDWDIAAGQFFTNWRHDVHVVEPFQIPLNWRVWLALDYGFTHPTVILLLAQDGDGNIYVVDEHCKAKWLVAQHVEAIRGMLTRHHLEPGRLDGIYAGADVFAQRGTSTKTIAEQYADGGFPLRRANNDRINGWAEMLSRMGSVEDGRRATFFVMARCVTLLDCLPTLEHDPARPEDVLKVDVDEDGNGGDDAADACRYGIMAAQDGGSFVMRYA